LIIIYNIQEDEMIRDGLEFRTELEKINKWWFTNSVEEAKLYPLKREQFETLKKELQTPRINIVGGPRRVGKSILVKQAIIKRGVRSQHLTFFSECCAKSLGRDSVNIYR